MAAGNACGRRPSHRTTTGQYGTTALVFDNLYVSYSTICHGIWLLQQADRQLQVYDKGHQSIGGPLFYF
ncbi:hypothetical protein D1872_269360 [compost metagenome]